MRVNAVVSVLCAVLATGSYSDRTPPVGSEMRRRRVETSFLRSSLTMSLCANNAAGELSRACPTRSTMACTRRTVAVVVVVLSSSLEHGEILFYY